MNEENEELDPWIQEKRSEPAPETSPGFTNQVMRRIEIDHPSSYSFRPNWIFRIAAVLVAGAVGFFRMELIAHLMSVAG